MIYDLSEPISIIFNVVVDLRKIAVLANRPYTEVQMINLGYMVLTRQPIFHADIRRWLWRNPYDQIWTNF